MKLWMTSESYRDVGDELVLIRNFIEKVVNEELISANFQMDGVEQWTMISTVLPDEFFVSGYSEVQKFYKKQKSLEYKLKIDYKSFLEADSYGKAQLIFDMLFRSIDTMASKKIPLLQIDELKNICLKALERVKVVDNLKKACLDMREKSKVEALEKTKAEVLGMMKIYW